MPEGRSLILSIKIGGKCGQKLFQLNTKFNFDFYCRQGQRVCTAIPYQVLSHQYPQKFTQMDTFLSNRKHEAIIRAH